MKVVFKYICVFIFVYTNITFCLAQAARFRHLTSDDGLTQNAVTCLHQDKKGFIWIGTYDGLNRYDGNKIVSWKGSLEDTASISSNSIRCFYEDNNDNLWVGTQGGGMFRIHLRTGRITNYYSDSTKKDWISSDNVSTIIEAEPGKLYLATGDGLNIFDKKTERFKVIRRTGKDSIPFLSNSIRSMAKDARGHLWLGHWNAGVTEYDPATKKCTYYTSENAEHRLRGNTVRSVFADSRGWIWVSLWNQGQNVIDTKTGKIYDMYDTASIFKKLKNAYLISQFYEDRKGNMWLATAEHGLCFFNPRTLEYAFYEKNPDDPETISDNTVFCVMEDRSGLIWNGTWKGGLNIFDAKTLKFGLYRHESNNPRSIHNNNAFAFSKKSDDEIYIGTAEGVTVYDQRTNTFDPLPYDESDEQSIRHNSVVYCLYTDEADGTLWISSAGGGLYHYFPDKKKYRNYVSTPDSNSFSWHSPSVALRDKKGRLWIATLGNGLNLYNEDKDNFSRLPAVEGNAHTLCSNNITAMSLRKDGLLWIGSGDNGLDLFDPDTREVLRHYGKDKNGKPIFPDLGISGIFYDRKGKLWLGTTGGLCTFDEKNTEVVSYASLHPAFAAVIYGIEEDHSGNIWFSSAAGITRFDPRTKAFKIFSVMDGLQGREYALRSVYKNAAGKLFFGGVNGFNAFVPEDVRSNTSPPGVALTGFTVLNKPYATEEDITYLEQITLTHEQYFFSLELAALDFTDPSRNTFKYFLERFNEDWVDNGPSHTITFTNLDPGEYVLHVKAVNNDGVESAAQARLKITITPPFWRTTWFYVMCVVLVAALFYLYIQIRERKLKREKALLEKKVSERTAELQEEKLKVEVAHKDIKDSIFYAQKIQSAILPGEEEFEKYFNKFFILFRPKDIVSGDFYWITEKGGYVFYATADCTGHGVPGGFMTMLGHGLLNEIINEKNIFEPAEILNLMREKIITSLKQTGRAGENKDGMDIVLCRLDQQKRRLCYAAANNTLILLRSGNVIELEADKQPVGIFGDAMKPFSQTVVELQENDMIYTFTDGYADQFGGPKGKKLKYKNMVSLFSEACAMDIKAQQRFLSEKFAAWKSEMEQLDDVLVIGVKI